MKQRMKKISAYFLAALAVLVSVLSVPSVAFADEGEWMPFVQGGQFLHPSTFNVYGEVEFDYFSHLDSQVVFNVSSSNRYRMRIVQYEGTSDEFDTGWFELSSSVESVEGFNVFNFVFDTSLVGGSGNLYLLAYSAYGETAAAITNDSIIPLGSSPFSLYVESYMTSTSPQQSIPAWANGQFTNQSMVEFFEKPAYMYGDRAPVPSLVDSPTGMYKITYNGVDYIVTSFTETNADGASMVGFNTDDGTTVGVMVDSTHVTDGIIRSYFFLNVDYVEGATLTMSIYDPPSADLPTFFGEAGSTLNWLISAFGVFLAFMLKNPICFIGLIVSLVVLAVKLIQSTTGNK